MLLSGTGVNSDELAGFNRRKNGTETFLSYQLIRVLRLYGFFVLCSVVLFVEISIAVSVSLQRNCSTTTVVWTTFGHSARVVTKHSQA